jgi:alpha-galactosidase
MSFRVSIIGAGSAVFSLGLIRDLALTPNLAGSTVSFMDVDDKRLQAVHRLAQRYSAETGAQLVLEATTDRRASLRLADVVIVAALTAGHNRLRDGWKLARRHGYRWGGSLHIMHDEAFWINFYQLQLFDSILDDMRELCPNATYIQIANPVKAGITYLARTRPDARIVGLCHGYGGVYHIARELGLARERLTFEVSGVNHFIWLTRMFHNGENVMPLLDRWIEEQAPAYWQRCGTGNELGPTKVDLYRRFGAYPIGDTAGDGGGSWGHWYHRDDATEQRWQEDPGAFWERFFTGGERDVAKIAQIGADQQVRVTEHFPPVMSGETVVPLIEALLCDIPRVIISNILNTGDFVPGVPADFQVEVPALVSRCGIQGIQVNPLPTAVQAHLLRDCVAPVNIELAAYQAGDRALLRELVMLDPWTHSAEQADALLNDIFALPYHAALRDHYT